MNQRGFLRQRKKYCVFPVKYLSHLSFLMFEIVLAGITWQQQPFNAIGLTTKKEMNVKGKG